MEEGKFPSVVVQGEGAKTDQSNNKKDTGKTIYRYASIKYPNFFYDFSVKSTFNRHEMILKCCGCEAQRLLLEQTNHVGPFPTVPTICLKRGFFTFDPDELEHFCPRGTNEEEDVDVLDEGELEE